MAGTHPSAKDDLSMAADTSPHMASMNIDKIYPTATLSKQTIKLSTYDAYAPKIWVSKSVMQKTIVMTVTRPRAPLRQIVVFVNCSLVLDNLQPDKKAKILSTQYSYDVQL